MTIHNRFKVSRHPKKTPEELYKQAHEILIYCPDTGGFFWKHGNRKHEAGDPAGTLSAGGYMRIFLAPLTYCDSVLAYLMMTRELHKHIGRFDLDITNCRFNNLYPSKYKVSNHLKYPKYSKRQLAEFLEANPMPIGKLATELRTVPMNLRPRLQMMVYDGYIKPDHQKIYGLTALGHRELVREGEFDATDHNVEGYYFQQCLPGTLTGGTDKKELKWELR